VSVHDKCDVIVWQLPKKISGCGSRMDRHCFYHFEPHIFRLLMPSIYQQPLHITVSLQHNSNRTLNSWWAACCAYDLCASWE